MLLGALIGGIRRAGAAFSPSPHGGRALQQAAPPPTCRAGAATMAAASTGELNVLGAPLERCSCGDGGPVTGFFRTGFCQTGPQDAGRHTVCAEVTAEWLEFSAARGNDLVTPNPAFGFPGLKPGDRWCLCVSRWAEALGAGLAPPVVLEACHASALAHPGVTLEVLRAHAVGGRGGSTATA